MNDNCSIMKEITKADEAIQDCYRKVTELETKLQANTLSDVKKDVIKRELMEVRKLLKTNEENLSKLHGQNRRTFILVILIVCFSFMIYIIYKLTLNYSDSYEANV